MNYILSTFNLYTHVMTIVINKIFKINKVIIFLFNVFTILYLEKNTGIKEKVYKIKVAKKSSNSSTI